jgi:hypothetical protein
MEGFREALRAWAGKQTEGARGWFASLGAWIKEKKGRITPRRALAVVVALSLWMGVGRMAGSAALEAQNQPAGEVFGEVHWYEG